MLAAAAIGERKPAMRHALANLAGLGPAVPDDPLRRGDLFRPADAAFWQRAAPVFDRVCAMVRPPATRRPVEQCRIRVRTLGEFSVERDGRRCAWGRKLPRRPLALLKALIAVGGRRVAVGTLIDMLWPGESGTPVRRRFDTALYRLRTLLGPGALCVEAGLLTLAPEVVEVDAYRFERTGDVSLYGGSFLPDELDVPWSVPLREALRERYQAIIFCAMPRWRETQV